MNAANEPEAVDTRSSLQEISDSDFQTLAFVTARKLAVLLGATWIWLLILMAPIALLIGLTGPVGIVLVALVFGGLAFTKAQGGRHNQD